MREITILGEKVSIRFCMAVEIAYEEITGEPFTLTEVQKQKNALALMMAAVLVSNPETKITAERLMNEASGPELRELSRTVGECMAEWMEIPAVEEKADNDKKRKKGAPEKN